MSRDRNDLLEALAARGETLTFSTDGLLFNAAVDAKALAIVRCRDKAHVSSIVRLAAAHGTPMAVLSGGHDLSGRAFTDQNLVLDIRSLSSIAVDRDSMTITAGGGAITSDLLEHVPSDLVTPVGAVSSVGLAGLALGGGYGRLTSTFGLTSDALEHAELVLADGTTAIASLEDDPDLLWALRGGGGGFGVVTSLRLRAYPMPECLTAMLLYPLDDAEKIMLLCQEFIDRHPENLNLFAGFMAGPDDRPVLFISPTWTGDQDTGETLVEELQSKGSAITVQHGWTPYKLTFDKEAEKAWPKGRNYNLRTQTVTRLDADSIGALIDGARRFTSPFSALVIHDFHGKPATVGVEASAFQHRSPHFMIEIIAAWEGSAQEPGNRHVAWSQEVSESLAAVAIPGGYPNLLSPDETDRVRTFYGSARERLEAIKRRVDPNDLFRSAVGRTGT